MIGVRLISTNTFLSLIEIFSNKTRSFLTSFGICIGAISLLANIAFVRAINDDVNKRMEVIGGLNIITIKKKDPVNKSQAREFNRSPGFTYNDAIELKNRFNYISSHISEIELPWGPVKGNGKSSWASINAVGSEYFRIYKIELFKGNFFSQTDLTGVNPVCIVGTNIISRLFGDAVDPIGKTIIINNIKFTIIGIIKSDNRYSWRSRQIFFPYQFYSKKFPSSSKNIEHISLELKNSAFEQKAHADFRKTLFELHRGIEDFIIESNSSKIKEMRNASRGIKIILYCIASISLFIGGISIMNIMFAAIGDRIREIGIRKALGAGKMDIIMQFLVEAIFLCFTGGIPGILIGGSVTFFPEEFFPFDPQLLFSDYVLSIAFIICTGIISGLVPALKAANLQPAEALRY